MTDNEYKALVKEMCSVHGIVSNASRRRGLEQVYFNYHYRRGVRLRGKYRPR